MIDMSTVMKLSGFLGLMALGRMVQSVAMTLFARTAAAMAFCAAALCFSVDASAIACDGFAGMASGSSKGCGSIGGYIGGAPIDFGFET